MTKYSFYRPHERVQYTGDVVDPVTGEVTHPPSMTKQEFARECDINHIIKQYSQTGILNHISAKAATGAFMDLPESVDFQESLHAVQSAEKAFMALPAKTRERFNNEPGEFLAFMENPDNLAEMRELGLARPAPRDEPAPPLPTPAPEPPSKG